MTIKMFLFEKLRSKLSMIKIILIIYELNSADQTQILC